MEESGVKVRSLTKTAKGSSLFLLEEIRAPFGAEDEKTTYKKRVWIHLGLARNPELCRGRGLLK